MSSPDGPSRATIHMSGQIDSLKVIAVAFSLSHCKLSRGCRKVFVPDDPRQPEDSAVNLCNTQRWRSCQRSAMLAIDHDCTNRAKRVRPAGNL